MPDNHTTDPKCNACDIWATGHQPSQDEIAVEITKEHDSEPHLSFSSHGDSSSWRKCATCGVEEEDDYDGDDGKGYCSPGNGLYYCSEYRDGCYCTVHAACAKTVGDKSGLCPHCAWMENEKLLEREEAETLVERTATYAAQDVKRLRQMLQSDGVTDNQREVVSELLSEIAQQATLALADNAAAMLRSAMRPLVAA